MASAVLDLKARPLKDLRISLTDRCNFRCTYCMPRSVFGPGYQFLKPSSVMSFDEIVRLVQISQGLGVENIRLTGGEPLLRTGLDHLVNRLSQVKGIRQILLTTNGSRLTQPLAKRLKESGLTRVTISLDALDEETFKSINDVGFSSQGVLQAIDYAAEAGLTPVKINMVVKKNVNADQILTMADRFRHSGHILRFIEFMDVGNSNRWSYQDVVSGQFIVEAIHEKWPLKPLAPSRPGEVARRYQYVDGGGEIGIITSVSQPFCMSCTRARLSAEGKLYLCLFANQSVDLLTPLRQGADDQELAFLWRTAWTTRDDQYSLDRAAIPVMRSKVEMSHIGG